jgi:SAM-dependent methyltransferase
VRVAAESGFAAAVLDAGCGSGENALHVGSLGLSVLGVDVAETAVALSRAKAADRRIQVEFATAMRPGWSAWGAGSTRCWTAGCSTHSAAMSGRATWRVSHR